MSKFIEKHAWLVVLVVGVIALGCTALSLWGTEHQRYLTATIGALASVVFMRDLTIMWDSSTRRVRRVSAAICLMIFALSYGSLDLAIHGDEGHPLRRVLVIGTSILLVCVAILWHPDHDDEVPPHREFPWERFLRFPRLNREN